MSPSPSRWPGRVITVSDRVSRGEAEDRSGPAAVARLAAIGVDADIDVVPDGVSSVADALRAALASDPAVIVTTGGTGPAPRDLTPEATLQIIERLAPGFVEAMRAASNQVRPHGMLSRGVAGITGRTLIVNLPGSVSGVEESLDVIAPALPHAIGLLRSESTAH
ncbi:MAG: MogA/MoaB family molybdenum cofactor biosynthesis protein [Acidimicrobiia bacterium]|nr:MogA/MoaB family molybdenum cofactor biosynthesis protein [Acidimicrobiia bacterium]